MTRHLKVLGLFVVVAAGFAVALTCFSDAAVSAKGQDELAAPPDGDVMRRFMERKLAAAQRTLEHVAKEDFDSIKRDTAEMADLSRHEAWERMASPSFVQDTVDFVSAAEFLKRMADLRDSEGTALGFARLTLSCTTCHMHVRAASVARNERLQKEEQLVHLAKRSLSDLPTTF